MFDGPFGSALKTSDYTAEGFRVARLENIGHLRFRGELSSFVSEEKFLSLSRHVLKADDVLFSSFVDKQTRVCLVPGELDGRMINKADCFCVRPRSDGYDPRLLAYRLAAPASYAAFSDSVRGVTRPRIGLKDLAGYEIEVPPLAEQWRIVAKLDALTARTTRARADLDRIPALVARYKQAVLAKAFRGELLGPEPRDQRAELDERCWPLPRDWVWVPFQRAAAIASNLTSPTEVPDLPHIAPDNVEARTGRLLPYRTIAEDGVISPKHRFKPGQIIYSKIRPYLRKAVLVDFEGACSADMYPLDPGEGVDPQFLLLWLISEDFAAFTIDHEGRTVLPKINQAGLNKTPFPLPPSPVQKEIARRVWSAFAEIDRLVAEAVAARRLLDRLDKVLLAKAFRGELVPQDPADEPASALLDRIRAERANAPKATRGRRKAAV